MSLQDFEKMGASSVGVSREGFAITQPFENFAIIKNMRQHRCQKLLRVASETDVVFSFRFFGEVDPPCAILLDLRQRPATAIENRDLDFAGCRSVGMGSSTDAMVSL